MSATTVLCPGQGAQAVGMGRAWIEASPIAHETFDEADAVVGDAMRTRYGKSLRDLCVEGPPEALNRTDVSQPAIYTCSVACCRSLRDRGEIGDIARAAGLSLGEYTALYVAGVFDFDEGLRLVMRRGELMQQAAEASRGGMVAVIGADESQAELLAQDAAGDEVLVCANFNAPGQVVLSGHVSACDRAAALGAERSLRCTKLTVAGAFHSPLMQSAADAMDEVLSAATLRPPAFEVWSNVTARPHDSENPELLRRRLVEQIVSPVRWSQTCQALATGPAEDYHELAPGSVLRGLARRIDRNMKVVTHDEP